VSAIDTLHRKLCHDLFDAIETGDLAAVDRCYAPDMTMWFNGTDQVSTREENLATLEQGYGLHRRRLYNDRNINTFEDGFVVQYTTNVVLHDGSQLALSACLLAEVRDGKIVRLNEYLDTGKFSTARRPRRADAR